MGGTRYQVSQKSFDEEMKEELSQYCCLSHFIYLVLNIIKYFFFILMRTDPIRSKFGNNITMRVIMRTRQTEEPEDRP